MEAKRENEREAALELLRSQHDFPGEYTFRIVVRHGELDAVVRAVTQALAVDETLLEVEERPSRTGRFVSLHIRTQLASAESVLDVYAVVSALDGVVMSL